MLVLSEQILSLDCDPIKANSFFSDQRQAYQEGHAAGLIQAADLAEVAPDSAAAAITYALTLGCEAITFLDLWIGGDFESIREEWPDTPPDVFTGADSRYKLSTPA